MKRTATAKAIQVINRRADSLAKIYGKHSPEYEAFTDVMADLVNTAADITTTKDGLIHIRNTKSARANYRQINAVARKVKKTPIQVEKRKAAKQKEEFLKEHPDIDTQENNENGFADYDTYLRWFSMWDTYFYSCYVLAQMEGYDGRNLVIRAKELYDDENEYKDVWNMFYKNGAFDEFKVKQETYNEQEVTQEYNRVDPETGNLYENPDFYEDINYD